LEPYTCSISLGGVPVHQRSLFGVGAPTVDDDAPIERIQLDHGAWLDVGRRFLRGADTLLDALIDEVEWRQGKRWMYDRMVDDPRQSRWIKAGEPVPHPALDEIRVALEARYGVRLGTCGLNYYRDGRDSVAPHSDRELRELDDTIVAIVTLGVQRPFLVRPKGGGRSIDVAPASGDLLVMGGACQQYYEHAVPKVAHAGPRISASYRWSASRPSQGPRRPQG
jgi:alkylated DNA repair dioxygenase AlkB